MARGYKRLTSRFDMSGEVELSIADQMTIIKNYAVIFSQEFESSFMNQLKRCHGTKRTFADQVYQEYIKDKE